eukprot:GGOE01063222.1.p5 GENE.GGOE01063222.1~~GGOE01063222.1.p5  ORF type:complete len:112 (-),score=5.53 GGOE01063222.1:111-446(-)
MEPKRGATPKRKQENKPSARKAATFSKSDGRPMSSIPPSLCKWEKQEEGQPVGAMLCVQSSRHAAPFCAVCTPHGCSMHEAYGKGHPLTVPVGDKGLCLRSVIVRFALWLQ